ncbi:MAG: DUF502 domain-containing protein [Chitinophagaceae bacterium]
MNIKFLTPRARVYLRRLLQYFLQGLIVIAPIAITASAIIGLFNWIDGLIPNILHSIFPSWIKADAAGKVEKIPGLGFVIIVLFVLLIGWLSSIFVIGKLVELLDKVLEKTPGIKFIYSSVKDFFEAFAGDKKKFDKPILVNINGPDVWRIAFITSESAAQFGMDDYVVVYCPHSYNISGNLFIVGKDKIKKLPTDISASDAMKFAVSAGVVQVDD